MKFSLDAGIAITAIISVSASAWAAEWQHKAVAPAYAMRAQVADRPATLASAPPGVRDDHVFEFLRWKEQLSRQAAAVGTNPAARPRR